MAPRSRTRRDRDAARPGPQSRRASRERAAPPVESGGFSPSQLLLLVPLLAVAASLTLSYLWNEDFWWYLTSGRHVLEQGRIPDEDPFLYTSEKGQGWVYHSWLWTVLVALVERLAGLEGAVIVHALLALALAVLVYTARPVDRLGVVNALFTVLFLATIGRRLCGKSEVATWLLLAVFYRLLERQGTFTWRRGAALGALQVLWANLHGGYPLGVFVALCYAGGGWIDRRRAKDSTGERSHPPLWFPALLFLLAVADPWHFRQRLAPFAFFAGSEAVQPVGETGGNVILEWQSPFRAAGAEGGLPWLYLIGVAAGAGSFLLARRRPAARLLFFAGMAVLGATAVRHLPGTALAAALVGISNLGESWGLPAPGRKRRRGAGGSAGLTKWLYPAAAGLLALTLLAAAAALRLARPGFDAGQSQSFFTLRPAIACPRAASFILERNLPGPIFNDYQMGGYLTYRLYPRHRLFIDPRVLDPALVVRYTEMVDSPGRWQQAERRYGFRTVVLGNFSRTVRSPLGRALLDDPRWRLAYADPLAVVFTRDEAPAAQLELPAGRVPFADPPTLVPPLSWLQRTFLRDSPENYLIEYLAVLGHLGRPREVIDQATAALREMPDHPLLHRQRCAAHLALGNVPAAVADCATAYQARPDDPQVVNLYTMALDRAGRTREARALRP